jgi:hypothetical protein
VSAGCGELPRHLTRYSSALDGGKNCLQQLARWTWLRESDPCPDVPRVRRELVIVICSEKDDRNRRRRRVRLQALTDFPSIHTWHHDVQDDGVGVLGAGDLQRLLAPRCGNDPDVITQDELIQVPLFRAVVNQQYDRTMAGVTKRDHRLCPRADVGVQRCAESVSISNSPGGRQQVRAGSLPVSSGLFPATALIVLIVTSSAAGQQRPLPLETPEGVGAGNVRLQAGVDYTHDARFTLSGLQGNLWRVALIGVDVGLSDIADLELSGGLRDHLGITSRTPAALSDALQLTDPTSTGAFDDIVIGTKLALLREQAGRPGVGIRVATRLPNAKHPSGLGQDTTDFFSSVIVSQSFGGTRVIGNVGLGLLGDPLQGNRRVKSLLYAVSGTRTVAAGGDAIAGVDGRTGPAEPGLESRAIARAGVARAQGAALLKAEVTFGLTSRDGNFGFAASASFTFHAFNP